MLAHSNLKMRQVAEYYGYKINRAGYINCPLHREKTPSLKIYDKSFYCFGCASGGSVIDFVMKVFVVDFKTALAKINEDFRLSGNKMPRQQIAQYRQLQSKQKQFDEWEKRAFDMFVGMFKRLNKLPVLNDFRVKYIDRFDYLSDMFIYGTDEEKLDFYKKYYAQERGLYERVSARLDERGF